MKLKLTTPVLLCFFASVAVTGSWHGFPLVDVFADETYFVYAPLLALKTGNLLPHHLPYGTFTYLLLLPLQALSMSVTWMVAWSRGMSLSHLLFTWPFIGSIAPRLLNAGLYLLMAAITIRDLRIGQRDERPYARMLLFIFLLNTVMLLVAHSGKMWMTSIFLVFLAGMLLPASPLLSVLASSLAFANFPIMGVFWIVSIATAMRIRRRKKQSITPVLAIGIVIPMLIMAINVDGILFQIDDILTNFRGIDAQVVATHGAIGAGFSFLQLHALTLWTFLLKLAMAAPFCLLALPVFLQGRRVNDARFWYALFGAILYLLSLALLFNPAPDDGGSIRYLSSVIITLLLVATSFEPKRSRLHAIILSALSILSLYTGIVFLLNLALPTTYNRAQTVIRQMAQDPGAVVLSTVREISFPYTVEAVRLTQKWLPGSCSLRCMFALNFPRDAASSPTYLLVHDPGIRSTIITDVGVANVIEVTEDPIDRIHVTVENGAGEVFRPAAWWSLGFGGRIRIKKGGVTLSIP